MKDKPNILYVVFDYHAGSMRSGADQRTTYLKDALEKIGNVYVFSPVFDQKKCAVDHVNNIAFGMAEKRMSLLYIINHFLTKFFHVLRYHPFGVEKEVKKSFPNISFDLVVCRFTIMAAYCKLWKIAPVIIDADDLPAQVFDTLKKEQLGILGGLMRLIVVKWQNRQFNLARTVFFANQCCLVAAKKMNGIYLPNLPPQKDLRELDHLAPRYSIMTVATFIYRPNLDGVRMFIEHVWQKLHREFPTLRYRLIGSSAPTEFSLVDGIDVLGFVDDLSSEYEHTYASVVPIYAGSGTCIKTLEAPSRGRIAVSSEFGSRGISDKIIGNGIEIARDWDEMYLKIKSLILNDNLRIAEEKRTFKIVNEEYSFAKFCKIVNDAVCQHI